MMNFIVLIVVIAWVLAMWGVLGYAIWRGWGPHIRSRRQKVQRIGATVKEKLGRQELNPWTQQMEYIQKVLVFECEDGTIRDYEVHDDVWDWLEVGDDGELEYRGELFVKFSARRPRYDLDKEFKRLTRT